VTSSPPRWTNQPLRLYHGTLQANARSIVSRGGVVGRGRPGTDFGPGFYTTSDLDAAVEWAAQLASKRYRRIPAVVTAELDRESLAALSVLSFARGDGAANDFWSFVIHCRSGARHHGRRTPTGPFYDVVVGPVTAMLSQRTCVPETDQISFHTPAAEAVLNAARWSFV
jgi:hypothetical protein